MNNDSTASRLLVEGIVIPFVSGTSGETTDLEAIDKAKKRLKKELGLQASALHIHRKSIDARKRNNIKMVYSVCAEIPPVSVERVKKAGIKPFSTPSFKVSIGKKRLDGRPVVIGFGPAGMFCAMALAENGYRPIVYERGDDVFERARAVENFINGEDLDSESNVQFGAGGAGTFSDGKLTTRIGDGLISYVLSKLSSFGAPKDIEYKSKPHIGTDVLRKVVANIDRRVRELGGEIHYRTRVSIKDGRLTANGSEILSEAVALAIGHSARDTYFELIENGYSVAPKPYSAGVRVEHLQSDIDEALYGSFAGDGVLGHAEYQLSYRKGSRGAYSFCMCPGGEVMAAASEFGGVVTNGMSGSKRDGVNANAAIAVSVLPDDYGNTPEGAIFFQRKLEQAAFEAGGGAFSAPMQTVGDFLSGRRGSFPKRIMPTYRNGDVSPYDLHKILPAFITDMLEEGMRYFGGRIRGFDADDVPMTGVETRTSSPVRILRDEGLRTVGNRMLFPCGEGAGYAGGIISAAIDGLRVAKAIMEEFSPL